MWGGFYLCRSNNLHAGLQNISLVLSPKSAGSFDSVSTTDMSNWRMQRTQAVINVLYIDWNIGDSFCGSCRPRDIDLTRSKIPDIEIITVMPHRYYLVRTDST
jgi:hypothetical protein